MTTITIIRNASTLIFITESDSYRDVDSNNYFSALNAETRFKESFASLLVNGFHLIESDEIGYTYEKIILAKE